MQLELATETRSNYENAGGPRGEDDKEWPQPNALMLET